MDLRDSLGLEKCGQTTMVRGRGWLVGSIFHDG